MVVGELKVDGGCHDGHRMHVDYIWTVCGGCGIRV